MKILVINPGSTSTKLAVYEDNEQVWRKSVFHSAKDLSVFHHINEQYEYRRLHVTENFAGGWNSLVLRCYHCPLGDY